MQIVAIGNCGISALAASTINAAGANCSNAGNCGISADRGSIVDAYNAIVQNQTAGTVSRVVGGSHIEATGINTTGGTVASI